jgi:hypothetical protein
MDESKEDVLGTDVIVVEHASFLLGEDNYASCSIGKAFEHLLLLMPLEG